jgi:Tol biopolymer transport system component
LDRPSGIYSIGIDGRDLRLVVRNARMPAYSPDGSRLAYVNSANDIVVADADGTNARSLADTDTPEDWPAWSPGGRLIAFERWLGDHSSIVVARSDGSGELAVFSSPSYNVRLPSWRPRAPFPAARRHACP